MVDFVYETLGSPRTWTCNIVITIIIPDTAPYLRKFTLNLRIKNYGRSSLGNWESSSVPDSRYFESTIGIFLEIKDIGTPPITTFILCFILTHSKTQYYQLDCQNGSKNVLSWLILSYLKSLNPILWVNLGLLWLSELLRW